MSQTIIAIDKQSIHRICSGQVVLDLATAVKELVENSIDAGATCVEIKFKENGLEGLEVIDNGSGIHPACYESIALKHYTSKLQTFEDLEKVTTFGFRGEALSSLCALTEVAIVTATSEQAPKGVRLEYDANGKLISQTPTARPTGTTVQLSKLFHSLPVRQREFSRNIKREYGKALSMIQSYAIISKNVRIITTNQATKGKTTRVLSTNGNKSIRENIANVFSAKLCTQIIPFSIDLSSILGDHRSSNESPCVDGFISKPQWGYGRSSADRHYLYINGRPCTLPKIAKAFNEVYRGFISNQYPFVVANIIVPTEPSRSTFGINPLIAESLSNEAPLESSPTNKDKQPVSENNTNFTVVEDSNDSQEFSRTTSPISSRESRRLNISTPSLKQQYGLTSQPVNVQRSSVGKRTNSTLESYVCKRPRANAQIADSNLISDGEESDSEKTTDLLSMASCTHNGSVNTSRLETVEQTRKLDATISNLPMDSDVDTTQTETDEIQHVILEPEVLSYRNLWNTNGETESIDARTMHELQSGIQLMQLHLCDETVANMPLQTVQEASINNTTNNDEATEALNRIIKKTDFAEMQILGQFNLGFIIAALDDRDLFIIDQHASDEKYNFETLQRTTRIEGQRLIRPQTPDLTVAEELIVMENVETLRANGFEIKIEPENEPTQRVKVTSQPTSKNTMFDSR
ncbi:Mismatch repair endonuclease pms2, partial [Apophysomyces sp. BC1015]